MPTEARGLAFNRSADRRTEKRGIFRCGLLGIVLPIPPIIKQLDPHLIPPLSADILDVT